MIPFSLAQWASSMGVRGRRTMFSHQPMAAMAAFTGMGLTSLNRALIRGSRSHCIFALPATSPSKNLRHISTVAAGMTLESTEITPLPPMLRSGTTWSSLPE